MSLIGKHALVVGGGRGIGAATVRLLAEQGATVAFSYLQNMASAEAVAEQTRQSGAKVHFWQADAHDADQVKALVQRTYELEGHLDIVVNCVPPQGEFKPFSQFTWDEFIRGTDSELKTAFELAQAALPHMRKQRSGHLACSSRVPGLNTLQWKVSPTLRQLSLRKPGLSRRLPKKLARTG